MVARCVVLYLWYKVANGSFEVIPIGTLGQHCFGRAGLAPVKLSKNTKTDGPFSRSVLSGPISSVAFGDNRSVLSDTLKIGKPNGRREVKCEKDFVPGDIRSFDSLHSTPY